MTDNTQAELDKLRKEVEYCVTMEYKAPQGEPAKSRIDRLMRMFTAHTNAEIAKVLDRLEAELNEQKKAAETNLAYHVDVTKNERLIRDWQGTVHGIEFCRPAIAAERAKLKEVK